MNILSPVVSLQDFFVFYTVTQDITIAIDGFSSCGKSTLAQDLASALHYVHVDSGAMYRAVTLYFIRHEINLEDESSIEEALRHIHIYFRRNNEFNITLLNGEDVESAIRSDEVNRLVSPVAAISSVRRFLVAQQRRMRSDGGGIVMDGRDIGTVVFPDAELKIFLTATTEVRVERRFTELRIAGVLTTREAVAQSLEYRDHIDTTRVDSPLRQADDAVVIDNTYMTRIEQLELALRLAHHTISQRL